MKYIAIIIIVIFYSSVTLGQVICAASSDSGSAYQVFTSATLGIETPDCEHTSFGPHVTQAYDEELDRNVFVFHSHIAEDNDRCLVQDRVRMEVKGGPNTSLELQHTQNSTSYYRWKFRLADDFKAASSFNHLFQNKAKEGNDDSLPVLTFTARGSVLELAHRGGETGVDLGVLATVNLEKLVGKWVEVYVRQVHSENGELEVTIKNMSTGLTLLQYTNNDIDLWRTGAEYNRPKWGVYRSKNVDLKDEDVRFSDFCISESDSTLCPAEAVLIDDIVAPTRPMNLEAVATSMISVDLMWDASEDDFGVVEYIISQDNVEVLSISSTSGRVENLEAGTSYTFAVQARDDAGNVSDLSNTITIITDAADELPTVISNPFPQDAATNVSSSSSLSWVPGKNTDSFNIYFGQEENPALLVSEEISNMYAPDLEEDATYYWRIGSVNVNGETLSDIWSFTTGNSNADFPWQVYRANERPELETNFLELNAEPMSPPVDIIVDDNNGSTNSFFGFRSNSEENFRWRNNFAPVDSVLTIVARLQAVDPDVNGICYFEIRSNGWRQKIRINQSTIKLERSTPTVEVDLPFDLTNEMHLIRIVSDGTNTEIYLDEQTNLFASATSDTPSSNGYFEWGKSGGADYGAFIDWIAIDKTGGYLPTDGSDLPSDLFLSSIATLSTIEVDGESLVDFSPNVSDYNLEIEGSTIPELSWTTTSDLASATVDNPIAVPNTTAVIQVVAQDGFTTRDYKINYVSTTSSENLIDEGIINVFPNPANDYLNIVLESGREAVATIYSSTAREVRREINIKGNTRIDVSDLLEGVYMLSCKYKNNKISNQFFKIK
jgi:hypothetical protein